jgi:hypothetical protein
MALLLKVSSVLQCPSPNRSTVATSIPYYSSRLKVEVNYGEGARRGNFRIAGLHRP